MEDITHRGKRATGNKSTSPAVSRERMVSCRLLELLIRTILLWAVVHELMCSLESATERLAVSTVLGVNISFNPTLRSSSR